MTRKYPWSYSMLRTWESCAAKYKFKYIDRLKDQSGPAAQRGSEIHATIENYIKGTDFNLHEAAQPYQELFDYARSLGAGTGMRYVEQKMGFDEEWHACAYDAKNAWGRVICDLVITTKEDGAIVYEWKSGKPKDDHRDQRILYGIAAMGWYLVPEIKVITHYLEGTSPPQEVRIKDTALPRLREQWAVRVHLMDSDDTFAPKPDFHCRWCSYSRDKGGPCRVG